MAHESVVKIGASLACADYLHLEDELISLARAGVDALHIDVMDGLFVPNYALNLDIMRAVRRVVDLPLDVHLMITQPDRYLERFAEAGASTLTVHVEACLHLQRTLDAIHTLGLRAGVALNPATPLQVLEYVASDIDLLLIMTVNPGFAGQKMVPSMLRKIADAAAFLRARQGVAEIQVDGNVSLSNAPHMVAAGATYLVGGTSSIFGQGMPLEKAVARLRKAVMMSSKER